jgi:hypothetical protein
MPMNPDPIVEEVRKVREEYAARFNHDLRAICAALREEEKKSGRTFVTLPPRKVEAAPRTPPTPPPVTPVEPAQPR